MKKEKDVDRSRSITPVTGRKLDFAIITLLVVAVGYFSYDKFVAGPVAPRDSIKTIAGQPSSTRWDCRISEIPDRTLLSLFSYSLLPRIQICAQPIDNFRVFIKKVVSFADIGIKIEKKLRVAMLNVFPLPVPNR